MSFGDRGYQHRFFHTPSPKKKAIYSPNTDNMLPFLGHSNQKYHDHSNSDLNSSSYVQYLQNSAQLKLFKQDAQYQRLKKRLSDRYSTLAPQRINTVAVSHKIQGLLDRLQDDKIKLTEQLKKVSVQRQQLYNSWIEERDIAWNYRKKYDKVKSILRKQRRQYRQSLKQEIKHKEYQKSRIDRLQKSVKEMNQELNKNSIILQKAVNRARTQPSKKVQQIETLSPQEIYQSKNKNLFPNQNQLLAQNSYMQKLRRQIADLDRKISNSDL